MPSLYVSRKLVNAGEVIAWAKAQGFKTTLQPGDLHVTIAYSKTPLAWPEVSPDPTVIAVGGPRTVTPMGDGGAVALKFTSPELSKRWSELMAAGAVWAWPIYEPHVTITWQAEGLDLSKVEPYRGSLIFGPEVFAEINEDWGDTVTEKQATPLKATPFRELIAKFEARHRQSKTAILKQRARVIKVDDSLGLVFGWAIVSKINGEDYFDVQDDHIPEESMLKAATDFMLDERVAKEMHAGDGVGKIVFAFPLTTDIAKAMGITTSQTGLMIAMKPDSDDLLNKFRTGAYTGFSIGGSRLEDEEVA